MKIFMKHNASGPLFVIRSRFDPPTPAHRLGYRLREIRSQSGFVSNLEKKCLAPEAAVAAGAWTLHPVKDSQIFAIVEQHIKMQSSASTRE
jgi:hypothetical protein